MDDRTIQVNRAPVLTLWAAVVAERLGHDWPAALTIGKVLSGLLAQSKGRRMGVFGPSRELVGADAPDGAVRDVRPHAEDCWVQVCGRSVPCKGTADGLRAVVEDQPVAPAAVAKYLTGKFGEDLPDVLAALRELAAAYEPGELDGVALQAV